MKTRKTWIHLTLIAVVCGIVFVQCSGGGESSTPSAAPVVDETDKADATKTTSAYDPPGSTCTLTPEAFAGWFSDGTITENGVVNSANSLLGLQTDCEFYEWSWQMFLWQVSPWDDSWVFDSEPFFDLEGNELVVDGTGSSVRGGKVESTQQAGPVGGVLMSQKVGLTPDGSLVYYSIHVNDVMAYLASGKNSGQLTDITEFPTDNAALTEIVDFAKNTYGATITDGNSLAMEMKSSWVQVPEGGDASDFITITADIPKYVQGSDKEWTWDGTTLDKNVTLAMVGYHVVGSVAGHPEMIWATFEHNKNTPDVNFFYNDTDGNTVEKVNFVDGKAVETGWMFQEQAITENASNQMHMEQKGNNIVSISGNSISPSSTVRSYPYGGELDHSSAANNTLIMSINDNIQSMLKEGDLRKNYFLVGATWTSNGVIPGAGVKLPEYAGSLKLANTTMETYMQFKDCFGCHNSGKMEGLSHIFGDIEPLPIPPGE